MRIALAAVLAFAAMWFVALKPKPADVIAESTAPAVKQAGVAPTRTDAGEKARKPAAERERPAEPKVAGAGRAQPILDDLDAGRTVVLLFWDGRTSDDRYVRRAVAGVDRHGGDVRVHVARIDDISRYDAITLGVPVVTTPTVLVIDRNRQARSIAGLTVTSEIDDAVDRARRAARG